MVMATAQLLAPRASRQVRVQLQIDLRHKFAADAELVYDSTEKVAGCSCNVYRHRSPPTSATQGLSTRAKCTGGCSGVNSPTVQLVCQRSWSTHQDHWTGRRAELMRAVMNGHGSRRACRDQTVPRWAVSCFDTQAMPAVQCGSIRAFLFRAVFHAVCGLGGNCCCSTFPPWW